MDLSRRFPVRGCAFVSIVVFGLASACAAATPADPTPEDPAAPVTAAGGTQGSDPTLTSPSNTSGPTCEELGTLAGTGLTAKLISTTIRSVTVPLANRSLPSRIGIIGVGPATSLVGNTVALGAAANSNYATCDHCLVIAIGCGTDCSGAAWFYPRSGAGTFTAVPTNVGDRFAGVFNDVVLEAVTVNVDTSESTPIVGGACMHIQSLTFDATAASTSSTSGGTNVSTTDAGSDGGTTTSTSTDSGTSVATDSGTTSVATDSGTTSTSSGTGSSGGTGHGGGGGDTLSAAKVL